MPEQAKYPSTRVKSYVVEPPLITRQCLQRNYSPCLCNLFLGAGCPFSDVYAWYSLGSHFGLRCCIPVSSFVSLANFNVREI